MKLTKIFKSGNSLAIRLPKEFGIQEGNEVEIFRRKGDIIIREIPKNLSQAFLLLTKFPDDFYQESRSDELQQERDF